MITWLFKQLAKVPQPYRLILFVGMVLALGAIFFTLLNQVQSCGYHKAQKQYQEESKAWATERAKYQGQIAERDKQIEQLKAKEAAIIAADQAGKKLDDSIATKIDEVTKAAADEAFAVDAFADCFVRADRTCTKLRGLKPPINIDCDAYKRKLCSE
jgi:flagellar basal body-associated protein FliL